MTYLEQYVLKLLETYPQMTQEIKLLRYEAEHPVTISPREMLEAMCFSRGENIGGHPTGTVSDKTNSIALSYQEKADRVNAEAVQELRARLYRLEREKERLEYVVSLLEARQQQVIRMRYFDGALWDDVSLETGLSIRTLRSIKNAAVASLVRLYGLIQTDAKE